MNLTSKKIHSDFIDILKLQKSKNLVINWYTHVSKFLLVLQHLKKNIHAYLAKFTICNFIDVSID